MKKISLILFCIGLIAGVTVGGIASAAALYLNPQEEYTGNPAELLLIFYMWFLAASCPFFIIALSPLKDQLLNMGEGEAITLKNDPKKEKSDNWVRGISGSDLTKENEDIHFEGYLMICGVSVLRKSKP